MGIGTTGRNGKYLYAIIAGSQDRVYGPFGLEGAEVHACSDGRVAAVVSDVPNQKIRPERRYLAAHQQVLARLMEETTPLPLSFGMIAKGPEAILRILALNRSKLLRQLQRVAGKVEMGLRVVWDVPNIFEYFVNTHPELRAARDRLLGTNRKPTQEEKIDLGRLFDRVLAEDRESFTDTVEEALSSRCFELKRNPAHAEREVMNLACLVGKGALAEFEAGVFEAASRFDNSFAFDYNGPWAPHNFAEVDLKV